MTFFTAIDLRGGLMFHERRLSRDSVLLQDVLKETSGGVLYTNDFSNALLTDNDICHTVSNDFPETSDDRDGYFAENLQAPQLSAFSRVILYCWNRDYPFDVKFYFDSNDFVLASSTEFSGNSHPCIQKSVYLRKPS